MGLILIFNETYLNLARSAQSLKRGDYQIVPKNNFCADPRKLAKTLNKHAFPHSWIALECNIRDISWDLIKVRENHIH